MVHVRPPSVETDGSWPPPAETQSCAVGQSMPASCARPPRPRVQAAGVAGVVVVSTREPSVVAQNAGDAQASPDVSSGRCAAAVRARRRVGARVHPPRAAAEDQAQLLARAGHVLHLEVLLGAVDHERGGPPGRRGRDRRRHRAGSAGRRTRVDRVTRQPARLADHTPRRGARPGRGGLRRAGGEHVEPVVGDREALIDGGTLQVGELRQAGHGELRPRAVRPRQEAPRSEAREARRRGRARHTETGDAYRFSHVAPASRVATIPCGVTAAQNPSDAQSRLAIAATGACCVHVGAGANGSREAYTPSLVAATQSVVVGHEISPSTGTPSRRVRVQLAPSCGAADAYAYAARSSPLRAAPIATHASAGHDTAFRSAAGGPS